MEFNALQYEEAGQITSQFYTEIGTKLTYCNRLKFYACAILKKENLQAPYITGNLGIIGIFSAIIALIWYYVNKSIDDQININYLLFILCFSAFIIFGFRNKLVELFSGLLPRVSHVKILKTSLDATEFNSAPLFIFVDEIDRIDAKSLQLLLNEILTLHEILNSNQKKIQHKFFLFYNLNSVRTILSKSDIADVDFYLQKYFHEGFKIYKPDFSHALHAKIYSCSRTEKIVTTDESSTNSNIFSNPILPDKKQVPSSEILLIINKNLFSFRDLDRFIAFLTTNTISIANALISDVNVIKQDYQFKVDILTIQLFFDYRHQINLHDFYVDIESAQKNKSVYKLLLDFDKTIEVLYGCSLFNDSKLITKISNAARTNLFSSELNHISLLYFDASRIYPSTVDNGKVNFNIDLQNRLENIFLEYNYKVDNGSNLIDYIEANLGEFYTSRQSNYPHLNHLSSMSLLLNETNFNDFMMFILNLEKRLVLYLQAKYEKFAFTTEHAAHLYSATICSVNYCLAKLLPSDPVQFNNLINTFINYKSIEEYSTSLLFYLGMSRVNSPYYPIFATNRQNILRLLNEIEMPDVTFINNDFNFLFLYEYFDTISKKNHYQTNRDFTLDSQGNLRADQSGFVWDYSSCGIVEKLVTILTSIDNKNKIETSYYGLFFVLGLLLYSKSQNILLKEDDLIIGGIKNTIEPWINSILSRTENYKDSQLCKDIIEQLNLFKYNA